MILAPTLLSSGGMDTEANPNVSLEALAVELQEVEWFGRSLARAPRWGSLSDWLAGAIGGGTQYFYGTF